MTEGEHLRQLQASLQQVLAEVAILRDAAHDAAAKLDRLLDERHPSIVITPEDDTGEPIEGNSSRLAYKGVTVKEIPDQ